MCSTLEKEEKEEEKPLDTPQKEGKEEPRRREDVVGRDDLE